MTGFQSIDPVTAAEGKLSVLEDIGYDIPSPHHPRNVMTRGQAGIRDNDENVGLKSMGKEFSTCG